MGNKCNCAGNNNNDQIQAQICSEISQKQQTHYVVQTENIIQDETIDLPQSSSHEPSIKISFSRKNWRKTLKQSAFINRINAASNELIQQGFDDRVFFLKDTISDVEHIKTIEKALKKHFIICQLNTRQIKLIIKKMRLCQAPKGTVIFKKGDPSFSYYILLSGKCRVDAQGQIKATIQPGDSFGDLGIINNSPRSASIYVMENCICAELNKNAFRQAIQKLNQMHHSQCKLALSKLQFYTQLTRQQRQLLSTNCIYEVYPSGKIIFKKGDDANSFYIIRQGIVTILEKKIDLKNGQCIGQNALLTNSTTQRTSTLMAKTKCVLLSINKNIICSVLGNTIKNTIKQNYIAKLLKQNDLEEFITPIRLKQALNKAQFYEFSQGDIVFSQNMTIKPGYIYVLLTSQLHNQQNNKKYFANTIIELEMVYKNKQIIFSQNFYAENDGLYAVISLHPSKGDDKENQLLKDDKLMIQIKSENLYVIQKVRSGNFSEIFACYCLNNNKIFAVKVLQKKFINKSNLLKYVSRQIEIFQNLPRHPFIVSFYKVIEDELTYKVILEMVEGEDFFEVSYSQSLLHEDQTKFYIAQIVLIIEHFHAHKVVYRDLKPENLIICLDGYLKLVDMGAGKILTEKNKYKTSTILGTPHYMAPQIISGRSYSFEVDFWSLGILLYQLSTGELPFGELNQDPFKIYEEIINKEVTIPAHLSDITSKLICGLLQKSSQIRYGTNLAKLKSHPYFSDICWKKLLAKQVLPLRTLHKKNKISLNKISNCLNKNSKLDTVYSKMKQS